MRSPGSRPRRRRRRAAALLAVVPLAAAGCGGAQSRDDLRRQLDQITSMASEGHLLAEDVSAHRAPARFVRVHARELADTLDDQAERLNDRSAPSELAAVKTRATGLAVDASTTLRRLQIAPANVAVARIAAARLRGSVRAADGLGRRL